MNDKILGCASKLRALLMAGALAFGIASLPAPAHAQNLIKQPGAHNHYKFELEPHLIFRYGNNTSAAGPGIRASIPFMHNGPISSINNNLAISFGLDMPYQNDAFFFDFPVVCQWNFYFTDVISVLAEAGLQGHIWSGGGNFDVDPIFQGGGRFQFGKVGVLVRVGYPALSVGANFQF